MKTFTSQIFMFLILATWFNFFSLQSNAQSFSHPATGLVVTGDVMHAQSGSNFIGVVYSRSGNVYYNQVNPTGVWGEETLLGTGSTARLAIDSNNHPHVVFTTTATPTKIAYLKYDGSNWSEVVYIESLNNGGTGSCSKPDLAVANNGDTHITYTDSHGSTGDDYTYPDIMYAKKTTENFNIQLIFRGYRDYSSSGSWGADYFSKGSYIAVNESGDYFIMAHKQNIWRWSNGTDNTYFIMINSNLGNGNINNYGSDIFTIHDLELDGPVVKALYKQSTFKASDLTVSGTTISFTNTQDITATSVSSACGNGVNLVIGGKAGTNNLFTKFDNLGHVYTDVVVKNTVVSAVEVGGVFYAVYTDNGDGMVKIREVAEPLSITRFEVPGQDGPAFIDGQAGTVGVKVASGTDLTNLIATFTTTTDVSGVTVESVAQTSEVTPNNFSAQLTYVLSDGSSSRNWLVNIGTGIANTIEAAICEGEIYTFGTQQCTLPGEYIETFISSTGSDSTVMLILSVNPNTASSITVNACDSYTAPDGAVYTTSGIKTAVIPNTAGCDSTITINLTINNSYKLPPSESLIAYYPFNGNASDESGNGHDGTVNGATLTEDRNGNVNSAYLFDGNDGIDIPHSDELNMSGPLSVSCWIKPTELQNAMIFGKSNYTSTTNYLLRVQADGNIQWEYDGYLNTTTSPLQANNWYHIVVTANNPGEQRKVYVNGQLIAETTSSSGPLGNLTERLTLGYSSLNGERFKGAIDEVRFYNIDLSGAEITSLYQESLLAEKAEICEGDSYSFGGTDYTTAGEYEHTFSTIHGCDSVVTLTLTVNPVYNYTETAQICAGDNYSFGGTDYTTTGEYEHTFTSIHDCDSTVTLTLTVNPVYNHTVQAGICEGESYQFGTETLTTAGEYEHTFTSVNGCDSTVTLTLTVHPNYKLPAPETHVAYYPFDGDANDVSGNGLNGTVNGATLTDDRNGNTNSAYFFDGYAGQNGIDVEHSDELYMDGPFSISLWLKPEIAQNALILGKSNFTQTTNYWVRISSDGNIFWDYNGIQATTTSPLQPSNWYHIVFTANNPGGEKNIYINGQLISGTNSYPSNMNFGNVTTRLTIGYSSYYSDYFKGSIDDIRIFDKELAEREIAILYDESLLVQDAEICAGDSYRFGGTDYTEAGEYEHTFTTINGCDSTVTLILTVNPVYNHTETAQICAGDSYSFGGTDYTEAGEYEHTFTTINGCDSTVTLNLTVNPVYNHTETAQICAGDSYSFAGTDYTTSGEYEHTFTSILGCDSTVTLTLTVNPVYNHTVQSSICEGESYIFGTETLTTAGEYEKTFTSIHGCDSTVTLNLTVNPVYIHTETVQICAGDCYSFGGTDYTATGDYEHTFPTVNGCDSTVTLTLTVNPVYNHTVQASICEGESYPFGTETLTTAGEYEKTFSSINGCDSTVTLTLTVNPVYNHSDVASICQGESYSFGPQTLTTSGEYENTFTSINGCDSTVTLNLTVNPVYNHTDVASICQGESYSFGPQTLTTSGEYEHTFTSVTGCDSTVTLTLTVNPVYNTTESLTVYEDDLPLQFGSQLLTAAGTFTETFPTAAGCDSTVTLTLTVKPADITPPVVVCNPISVSLNSSGQYVLTDDDINDVTDGTTDNDSEYEDLILVVVPAEFSCSQAGTNVPVMVVVTDLRANSDTCYTTVQVSDAIQPEITCRNTSLNLDENGQATLSISDVYSSATDACGIQSVTASKTTFYCQDLGGQIIQITATDNNNNSQTCYATIYVNDYLSPVFESVGNQVVTAADGACTASVTYPRISAFDNCGNVDIQLFEGLGENGIFPAGTTVERWVATDGSGNSDTLRFEIQVLTNPAKPAFDTLAVVETLEDSDWISVHLTHIYDGLDCEDSPLEFSLQPENELLFDTCQFYYVTGNDSALLRMLPAPDAFGETKAVIKARNPDTGLEYSDTLTLRITPVNDPPFVVRPLEDLQTRAGDTLKMLLIPEQGYYFDDIDDETLQLSLKISNGENIPGWLQFRNDSILAFPAIADTGCINVILVATDLAGEEVYSPFIICVGFPVGIQTLDSQNLKVYPNPTTGKVYVDFLKNTGEKINISVVNYLGQEVLQKMYQGEERIEIDLTGKSSGMYIIRAKGKDFDANFRIILKPLK